MSALTNYAESALIKHLLGEADFTQPTEWWLALFTADPGEAAGGTEVSGAGYARQEITWNAESGGAKTNDGALVFGPAEEDWGTVTHAVLFDASTAGNRLMKVAITSQAITDGGTLTVPDEGLVASLA